MLFLFRYSNFSKIPKIFKFVKKKIEIWAELLANINSTKKLETCRVLAQNFISGLLKIIRKTNTSPESVPPRKQKCNYVSQFSAQFVKILQNSQNSVSKSQFILEQASNSYRLVFLGCGNTRGRTEFRNMHS